MPDFTTPAAMRAILDATFAGEIDRQIAPRLWLTLERSAHCWRTTLASGRGPVTLAACDRVATAVSAPSLDGWVRNPLGTIVRAEWREGWPPVRMVGR
jgi:hypothetical protein